MAIDTGSALSGAASGAVIGSKILPGWGTVIGGGIGLIGGILSGNKQKEAADKAAKVQLEATRLGIAETGRQFDATQQRYDEAGTLYDQLLAQQQALYGDAAGYQGAMYDQLATEQGALYSPYINAGTGALGDIQNLIGQNDPGAQQKAIDALINSPQYQSQVQQGENALLQNASATGGLRGGNIQGALAQFRPQLLSQLIDQQIGRLGGLATSGQNAAANYAGARTNAIGGQIAGNQNMAAQLAQILGNRGQVAFGAAGSLGAFGQNAGATTANLYGQQGQIQGQQALAGGQSQANLIGNVANYGSLLAGMDWSKMNLGGTPSTAGANVQTGQQDFSGYA